MILPNVDRTIIDRTKVRHYILSPDHPIGRFKARFFAQLGFSVDEWDRLERALREQHLTKDAESAGMNEFGQTFTIHATLKGPSGASAKVISVWFIRTGEDHPRFVTAYPGGSK